MRQKFAAAVVFIAIIATMAISSAASERRHASIPQPQPSSIKQVETVVSVTHPVDKDGNRFTWVLAISLKPVTAGTTYIGSVRKPGESKYTLLPQASTTVRPDQDGLYQTIWMYLNTDFYDVQPDGTFKYWPTGIADFRVDVIPVKGDKTAAFAQVPVGMGDISSLGPLQNAIVSEDGKTILVTGVFTPPLKVALLNFQTVDVSGNMITVPDGLFGVGLPLVVASGYPEAECSTKEDVNIPTQVN